MRAVETRYARSGRARIAYQVIGQGSFDLIVVSGALSNLDILWEDPAFGHLAKRLSVFSRLILFDPPGMGLSDPIDRAAPPDLVTRTADIAAVMDAAGSNRAALLGTSEGAAMSVLFAASRPERVRSLVLYGGYARFHKSVMDTKRFRAFLESIEANWGSGASLSQFAPGRRDDQRFVQWWARLERLSASPGSAIAWARMNASIDLDIRPAEIKAPTLLFHRTDDPYARPEGTRELASVIRGARVFEIAGRDHPIWMGDVDRVADLVEEFLTGERPMANSDHVLSIVLVSRLSGSGGRARDHGAVRHPDERIALFRQAVPKVMERHSGHAEWLGADRIAAYFRGSAHTIGAAVALRETAASLGLAIAQGIHVGEIDASQSPISGVPIDIADRIAASAYPPDILLSRLASDLVSASGLQFIDRGTLALDDAQVPLPMVALATERHLEPLVHKTHAADPGTLSPRERQVVNRHAKLTL